MPRESYKYTEKTKITLQNLWVTKTEHLEVTICNDLKFINRVIAQNSVVRVSTMCNTVDTRTTPSSVHFLLGIVILPAFFSNR